MKVYQGGAEMEELEKEYVNLRNQELYELIILFADNSILSVTVYSII